MRLNGRNGDNDWQCFDVERSAVVPRVVWIDEESATWGEYDLSPAGCAHAAFAGWLPEIHHQEKRIQICFSAHVVLFNPVDDEGETVAEIIREFAIPGHLLPTEQTHFPLIAVCNVSRNLLVGNTANVLSGFSDIGAVF